MALDIQGTDYLKLPVGTTAQRPAAPTTGMTRMNSTTGVPEWYDTVSGTWIQLINTLNSFGFKNRIINGEMQIDQRNAGAAVTRTASGYSLDRWAVGLSQASKLTFQQSTDAPAGAKNSLKVTVSSQYSPISTDVFGVYQGIEGFNISDLQWGTAGALTITTSYQVKSSVTGTFSVSINNGATNRSYIATYTISSANTWTPVVLTISGDQTGTWATDNTSGIWLIFDLGYGSNFNTTAGSWISGNYRNTSGSVKFVNQTAGATWQLAQVQLEVGSVATSFDVRDYGRELMMCQRYYEKSYNYNVIPGSVEYSAGTTAMLNNTNASTNGYCSATSVFKVQKRTSPTMRCWDFAGNLSKITTYSFGGLARTDGWSIIYSFNSSETNAWMIVNQPASTFGAYQWDATAEL